MLRSQSPLICEFVKMILIIIIITIIIAVIIIINNNIILLLLLLLSLLSLTWIVCFTLSFKPQK